MAPQLTARQTRFVEEYIVSGNAAAAARAAGYGERSAKVTACRMLTKANLKTAIAAKKHAVAADFELRRENIIGAIMQAIAMAKEQQSPSTMISGLVQIAKLCGFYDPATLAAEKRRQQPDGSENIKHVPTAELLRRLANNGEFRSSDGSSMVPSEIDSFYQAMTDAELKAFCEGRAHVVTKVVINDP
jgi:hypothetical protein